MVLTLLLDIWRSRLRTASVSALVGSCVVDIFYD